MKKLSHYFLSALIAFFGFNFLMQNKAQADPRQSYENYLLGKAIFIDVREEEEVKKGMIKGAFWFPLSKIEENKTLEISKIKKISNGKEIYIYCRSGNRSSKVQAYLKDAGIKSNNIGGYSNLVDEDLPTQPGP